jgi:hypothetical protein
LSVDAVQPRNATSERAFPLPETILRKFSAS